MQERYRKLVAQHTGQGQASAAGLRILPEPASAWAAAMAAWRFLHNPRLTPKVLARPLLDEAHRAVPAECADYVLAVHDWSDLDFRSHASKADRMVLGQAEEVGYELHTCLLVGDAAGDPLAPAYLAVRSASGLTSSRRACTGPWPGGRTNLDALAGTMNHVRRLRLGRPAVHVIDQEADSVAHFRAWAKAGHLFLVRVKGTRLVRHGGEACKLREVVRRLRPRLADARGVLFHGRPARQFVAETDVVLDRPAKPQRRGRRGPRPGVKGPPPPLRLVVGEVRDAAGAPLAEWLLLTNAPAGVPAATVALWYYWRWRIESYFRLLKSAGQQVEHWQQETAEALTRRLLVASMACVLAWRASRRPGPEGEALRDLLVRLSGRLVRRRQRWTLPALLEGLWVLLAMADVSRDYTPEQLRAAARTALGDDAEPEPPGTATTHGPPP